MLILGVDTSGKHGSIALVRCAAETSETLDLVPLEGGTFSAQLVPQIATLLQKHGLTKQQIDAFAVVSGPGSFTGLRVGLAAVKALAEILQKPIAAVSLLEVIAVRSEVDGVVLAVLDGGRGELYAGTYEIHNRCGICISEQMLTLPEFLAAASGRQVVTPDEKLANALRDSSARVQTIPHPQADSIARLGFSKIAPGVIVTPEALDATYIRRTDAEIKLSTTQR